MQTVRQGDVLLQRVAELPKGATKKSWRKEGRIVLAYGEVTGHAHALELAYSKMYEWQGDRLIECAAGAKLEHEEHATITLEPGVYKVIQQREYTPQGIRNVAD